jgi:hypothetical protein
VIQALFWIGILWMAIYAGLSSYAAGSLFLASFHLLAAALAVISLIRLFHE